MLIFFYKLQIFFQPSKNFTVGLVIQRKEVVKLLYSWDFTRVHKIIKKARLSDFYKTQNVNKK